MATNDIIVQVVFGADGVERVVADDASLDLFSVRGKSIEQCFAPSGGRASWEGLIEEIQRAVQDHEARILFYFENETEALKASFIDCLNSVEHEVDVVQSNEAKAHIRFEDAMRQKRRGQYDHALSLFLEAHDMWPLEEIPEVILSIGAHYEKTGAESKAWDCCEKAAGLGHSGAQWKVAEHLWSTTSAQDVEGRKRAVDWARKAAGGGIAPAQRFLGDRYLEGDVLEQNDEQAERWYRLAAAQGDAEAKQMLADFFSEEMRGLSLELRKMLRQAKRGDADAQYQMGERYSGGKGVKEDKAKAFHWYMLPAKNGHCAAQFRLSMCYHNGLGVEKNSTQAIKWLAESAMQGYIEAQYTLAKWYFEGKVIPHDLKKAEEWAKKAAEAGDREAKVLLEQIRKSMVVSIKALINAAILKSNSTLNVNYQNIYPPDNSAMFNVPYSQRVYLAGDNFTNTYIITDAGIYTYWTKFISWSEYRDAQLTLKLETKDIYSLYCSENQMFNCESDLKRINYTFWKELQQQIVEHWGRIYEIPSNLTSVKECIDTALQKAGLGTDTKRREHFSGVEASWKKRDTNIETVRPRGIDYFRTSSVNYADLGIPIGANVYLAHNAGGFPHHPMGFALTNEGIFTLAIFNKAEWISWNVFIDGTLEPLSDRNNSTVKLNYREAMIPDKNAVFFDSRSDKENMFLFWKILQQLLIVNRNNIPELEVKPNG